MKKRQSTIVNRQSPKIDIDHVSKLANLLLTQSEKQTFEKQLNDVLGYINNLEEIDTAKVEAIGHITGLENINREDNPSPSLTQEEALRNASRSHNGFFEVDAIFEENSPE